MENEQQKTNDEKVDERDELDDLDVSQQQAEDVKGGRRAIKRPEA